MHDFASDPSQPSHGLTPDDLPRLAVFIAAFLRHDSPRPLASAQQAAWEYLAEAELDELQELARDWDLLRAAARELPLADLNRLLGERFGCAWIVLDRNELDAVGAEFERALRE